MKKQVKILVTQVIQIKKFINLLLVQLLLNYIVNLAERDLEIVMTNQEEEIIVTTQFRC